ncbi:hypothetical protein P692DRAFT_20877831 [Suillus brevipes Sb2]|nr:hypothetical protein P692DRAFT_20877831 [Suillus brevipes Sb2]
MLDKPWALKTNREVAAKYFRIVRTREEIHRLNIEIARLQKWVNAENAHMLEVSTALSLTNPVLVREIQWWYEEHRRVNNLHRVRLEAIYNLAGYSGVPVEEENVINMDDEPAVLEALRSTDSIEIDEDYTLCDKADHLESCLART